MKPQAIRYKIEAEGVKNFLVLSNGNVTYLNNIEVELNLNMLGDTNTVELRHALEHAERERFTGSKTGTNLGAVDTLVLRAIKKFVKFTDIKVERVSAY
jgi:hypothetical protein